MIIGDDHHDNQHVDFYILQSDVDNHEQYIFFVDDDDHYNVFVIFFIYLSR